jgi:hypothetical protein
MWNGGKNMDKKQRTEEQSRAEQLKAVEGGGIDRWKKVT